MEVYLGSMDLMPGELCGWYKTLMVLTMTDRLGSSLWMAHMTLHDQRITFYEEAPTNPAWVGIPKQ